ncbi:NUDIX domain-containing protein [Nocardia sp. NPDC046763]|uniref:NUDIX domain-containing protein n=1 Tax=Nocardia sp. NPDC046763 TaxID=3155256 RepID=UPI0034045246
MRPATAVVAELLSQIAPYDELERHHIATTLDWLHSTDDIFRRQRPGIPSPHLAVYVVMIDAEARGVYLGCHRLAGLEIPTGGHVEPGEHPTAAAHREACEELGITPRFDVVGEEPVFVTVGTVATTPPHIDVSLWYVIRGDRRRQYALDPAEFNGGRWWDLDPYGLPDTDPHLPRFLRKLDTILLPQEPQ